MLLENANIYTKDVVDNINDPRFEFYINTLETIYKKIMDEMYTDNPFSVGNDKFTVATSVDEMLYIAKYIYVLNQHNIPGHILECGCFQGYSSCCLSWAASYFGYHLIMADSFEGLPDVNHPTYKPHEFRGNLDIVTNNVTNYGVLNSVTFRKGWYNLSLKGFPHELAMLWMDVDLYDSAMDVLKNVYSKLHRNGVLMSHEFWGNLEESEVYIACRDFFDAEGINVKVEQLVENLGVIYRV